MYVALYFLAYGTGISALTCETPVLENSILHPNVRQVTCGFPCTTF